LINKIASFIKIPSNIKAYRYDPSNLQTIEWLGSYYIDSQYPEKAVEYFEKASLGR
jgi:hypothetical protein